MSLTTKCEVGNPHDRFAVAVMKDRLKIGHVPREISKLCCLFLKKGGTLTCTVTVRCRRSEIEEGSLETPCDLHFEGLPELVKKFSKVVKAKY